MKPITHGTTAGYRAHYRRNEKPCTHCKAAYDVERPERNAAARARKQAQRDADDREYGPARLDVAMDELPLKDTLRFLSDNATIAACRDSDPDMFLADDKSPDLEKAALRVCYGCALVRPCLIASLANKSPGVWGATTARERRRLLREKRAAA